MLNGIMRSARGGALAAVGFLALFAASPANAFYDVCNRTGFSVDVSMAYFVQGDWISVGWYNVPPGGCERILTGALDNQYYYVFAERVGGGYIWDGEYYFCASDNAYEIFGAENCRRRGYYELGFFEVDVRNSKHWTTDLVE